MTTTAIALDIADESEASYLEGICTTVYVGKQAWLDVTPFPNVTDEALYGACMRRAIDYLTRRDLLVRHRRRKHLVRIQSAAVLGNQSRAPFEQ